MTEHLVRQVGREIAARSAKTLVTPALSEAQLTAPGNGAANVGGLKGINPIQNRVDSSLLSIKNRKNFLFNPLHPRF